jgi:hypothetical protein
MTAEQLFILSPVSGLPPHTPSLVPDPSPLVPCLVHRPFFHSSKRSNVPTAGPERGEGFERANASTNKTANKIAKLGVAYSGEKLV